MAGLRDYRTDNDDRRLETPRAVGFRAGMSPERLIGRRLAAVYNVTADIPRDMRTLLRSLDGRAR